MRQGLWRRPSITDRHKLDSQHGSLTSIEVRRPAVVASDHRSFTAFICLPLSVFEPDSRSAEIRHDPLSGIRHVISQERWRRQGQAACSRNELKWTFSTDDKIYLKLWLNRLISLISYWRCRIPHCRQRIGNAKLNWAPRRISTMCLRCSILYIVHYARVRVKGYG